MVVEITSLQTAFLIDESRLNRYAEWIMHQVATLNPEISWRELSVVLVDDAIRDLNRTWFRKDTVTDVISFAYPEDGTGEVIVNVRQAMEEGRLRESPDRELALYLAHGCDHLSGAEDDTPARKSVMLDRENAWVDLAEAHGLCGGFFL